MAKVVIVAEQARRSLHQIESYYASLGSRQKGKSVVQKLGNQLILNIAEILNT